MWEYNFAKETMDYRLFWLRFVKRIWHIIDAMILGAILVGVPYYLVNITFGPEPGYKMVSEYYLDYEEDAGGTPYEYFNFYTWSTMVDTDKFIAIMQEKLDGKVNLSDEEIRAYIDATVESDVRFLSTIVQTQDEELTITLTRAMEESIPVWVDRQKELKAVESVTVPMEAEKTYPDVRPVRAFILGGVLGLFVGTVALCIYLVSDSSVLLPHTMEKRYGVKALGCQSFGETQNNIRYVTGNKHNVMLLCTGWPEKKECNEAVVFIRECLGDDLQVQFVEEDVLSENFDFEEVRKADALILLVQAGAKNGKKIERIVEQIKRQDITISGAFLYKEDKKLIKRYYR